MAGRSVKAGSHPALTAPGVVLSFPDTITPQELTATMGSIRKVAQAAALAEHRTLSDLLAGLELGGRHWCYTDLALPAGFSVPPADALFVHCVLHGQARLACASGEVVELATGDVAFVPSGEAHALRTTPDAPVATHPLLRAGEPVDVPPAIAIGAPGRIAARVLSARLQVEWPGGVKGAGLPSLLHLGASGAGPLPALLTPDALALAGMGAGSAALLTRLAGLLLVAALRADPRCRQIFTPARNDPVRQALDLIEANPSAPWSVEKLARSVGMGRSNFAAHFTQGVGRAPMEVVAEKRMEHAAGLLRLGRLKVAEISELAGYGSEAAFSRRFTRHFGISPSQMRENARGEQQSRQGPPAFASFLSGPMLESAAALGRQPNNDSAAAADPSEKALGLRGILLRSQRRPR
jgi:AraC-like DNA-binding protein